jgi:M6 family metalloprotease-like protein
MKLFAQFISFVCWFGDFVVASAHVDNSGSTNDAAVKGQRRVLQRAREWEPQAVITLVSGEDPKIMTPNPQLYSENNADGSKTPLIQLITIYNNIFEVTVDGFTLSKINGYFMYMEYDANSGKLVSSGLIAGIDDPQTAKSKTSGKLLEQKEHLKVTVTKDVMGNGIGGLASQPSLVGTKKMLMVPFIFSDHKSRLVPLPAQLAILMNQGSNIWYSPTGSVKDYFLKNSFNKFELDSFIAPWVVLPNTEKYYANGDSGLTTLSHTMIQDALIALQNKNFDFTPFDADNDGNIDAIGFFHSGYAAEFKGTDEYGTFYVDRIWSHSWSLFSLPGGKWTSTSGKSVTKYHISSSFWETSGTNIARIGVIVHETAHFFGLPDLYDTDKSGGEGVGKWCLMGSGSWGFDSTQYYPSHLSAWSKIQVGWVTPTVITSAGTYTTRQACTNPDVFKISKNFPSKEYLLIENRQKCSFDEKIPGPGLAVFHVDDSKTDNDNEGFPGQADWPQNGNHYQVALLQADGLYDLEKGKDRGDSTDLFGASVTSIGPGGTSSGAANPNTNAYQNGNIKDTCITIKNIGKPSSDVSFYVSFVCSPLPKPIKPAPKPVRPVPKPIKPVAPVAKPKPAPKKVKLRKRG